jgi:transcription termination factor Rho
MSGEPQLERSVLEGKERDKLQAIADALGLKPTARTKKADLIDGILRATGVEAPPAEVEGAKPRRTTRKRAAEVAELPGGEDQGVLATLAPVDESPDAGPAAPAPEPRPEPATDTATDTDTDTDTGAGGGAGSEVDPDGPGGPADVEVQSAPVREEPPAPPAQPQPPRAQPSGPPGPPGPGNHAVPPPASLGQQPNHGQQTNQGQQSNQHQTAPQGQPGTAEGDVRRNRRRRGRDRDRLGSGYDQQAQQGDSAFSGEPLPCDGLLELRPEGYGFLRTSGYLPGPDDVYVSTSQVRKFALRPGDRIVGASRPATTQERYGALLRIDAVGDQSPDDARRRTRFDDLTPLFPDERLTLELGDPADPANTTGRIIDLLSPIGKGQRGMIVSPPKAGKTTVMKHIAKAIEANHPDVDLMVLLVDERPEEVTDMRRSVKGEVIGSTFDRPAEEHTHVAELAIEVAKRRVELGRDVVIILDGITRLARAYNLSAPTTGRVMSGGVDSGALYPPKKFFGAARNVEEGGSLTILATALVETGSTMDTVIFEEFKGTGNMELRLDRRLAERRMYPAIDVTASSTRHEELLLSKEELRRVWELRRALVALAHDGSSSKAYELLLDKLKHTRTNADFLADLARSPA